MSRRPSLVQAASPNDALIWSWNAADLSLAPNFGSGVPTFTRAGATATRVNSSGLIESVAADMPRFDYDPFTLALRGFLVERSATNAAWPSEDFTHANYDGGSVGVSRSTASVDNPKGGTTAGLITSSAGAGYHYCAGGAFGTLSSGATYSQTYIVKRGTERYCTVGESGGAQWLVATFDFVTEAFTNQTNCTARLVRKYAFGWYELSVTFTRTDTSAGQLTCSFGPNANVGTAQNYTAGGAETGYWFFGQHETGAFATSLISTTSAAVARGDDVAALAVADVPGLNPQNCTLFTEFEKGGNPTASQGILTFARTTPDTSHGVEVAVFSTYAPGLFVINGGVQQVALLSDQSAVARGAPIRLAAGIAVNDFALSVLGSIDTDSSGSVDNLLTRLLIGRDRGDGNSNLRQIHFKGLRMYSRRISNAEHQALTA